MTTEQKLTSMLEEHGMFQSQAEAVVNIAKPELEAMAPKYRITWDGPADEYPKPVFTVLFIALKPIALKWIEANAPMAWFKPMFQ